MNGPEVYSGTECEAREIFVTMDSAAVTAGKYGFNFERARRFRGRFTECLECLQITVA